MPEGDTIFRAAQTLHRALAGRVVTEFDSMFPALTRVNVDTPIVGRTIESVTARGKHSLMAFSGDLVLRTHMRMNGSWHIYRPGERWQRPPRDMRVLVGTDAFVAVGFNVPDAELLTARTLDRHRQLQRLGPDLLDPAFDRAEALRRMREHDREAIADVLLNQRVMAGIGNVFKSEILFMAGVHPFAATGTPVARDTRTDYRHLADATRRQRRQPLALARAGVRPADDRQPASGEGHVGLRTRRRAVPQVWRDRAPEQDRGGCAADVLVPALPGALSGSALTTVSRGELKTRAGAARRLRG